MANSLRSQLFICTSVKKNASQASSHDNYGLLASEYSADLIDYVTAYGYFFFI